MQVIQSDGNIVKTGNRVPGAEHQKVLTINTAQIYCVSMRRKRNEEF